MSEPRKHVVKTLVDLSGQVIDSMTGIDFVGGTKFFLSDHPGPAPVIPPDLHLVKPAQVDPDGNVTCIWCGAKVAYGAAELVGREGFSCGRHAPLVDAGAPLDVDVRRRLWPWLVGALAVVAFVVGTYAFYTHRAARAAFEARYAIVPRGADAVTLEHELPRWRRGKAKLLATLRHWTPPPLDSLHLGGGCPLPVAAADAGEVDAANTEVGRDPASVGELIDRVRDPDPDAAVTSRLPAGRDLAERAQRDLDQLFEAAERGRFHSVEGRDAVVRTLAGSLLVVDLQADVSPELDDEHTFFRGGRRAGRVYAFDPATGRLACAGAFSAESSPEIRVLHFGEGGLDNAVEALRRDLDARTDRAIASALRQVQ